MLLDPDAPYSSLTVAEGVVYVTRFDHLYALDAAGGEPLWEPTLPSTDPAPRWSGPVVADGVLYVGSSCFAICSNDADVGGYVHALDAGNGARLWRYPVQEFGVRATPAVSERVVYVSASDGHLLTLDAANGERLWSYKLPGRWPAAPTIVDGVVYIASSNGVVYALRPAAVE